MTTDWIAPALAGTILGLAVGYVLWAVALARHRHAHAAALAGHADASVTLATREAELAAARAHVVEHVATRSERDRIASELAALSAGSAAREAALAEQAAALKAQFETLAAAALQQSQAHFRELAAATLAEHRETADAGLKALLTPVADTLTRYDTQLKAIEATREQAYGSLHQALAGVAAGQVRVAEEAGRLVGALRSSSKTSGSWGEQQLKNVLELAGLREGVDFVLQPTTDGGARRPDAIIRLPGGRELIVDSKCSLNDFMEAHGCADGDRAAAIARHAAAVKTHARGLAEKAYWKDFGASADFVVMFLPGENYLSAALESDLALLDWAFQNRILLAGPINLLAIAKTVALVWRQETLANEAREIGKLGAELYASVAVMAEHIDEVGDHLSKALFFHNKMIGSLEQNVLPKARRLPELGVDKGKKPVPTLAPVEIERRMPVAPELRLPLAAE